MIDRCDDLASAACLLERCICDVGNWMSASRLTLNTEKAELLWAGSRYGPTSLESSAPSLRLGAEIINASNHVRILGATILCDLTLDKHVFTLQCLCFVFLLASPAETGQITRYRGCDCLGPRSRDILRGLL